MLPFTCSPRCSHAVFKDTLQTKVKRSWRSLLHWNMHLYSGIAKSQLFCVLELVYSFIHWRQMVVNQYYFYIPCSWSYFHDLGWPYNLWVAQRRSKITFYTMSIVCRGIPLYFFSAPLLPESTQQRPHLIGCEPPLKKSFQAGFTYTGQMLTIFG